MKRSAPIGVFDSGMGGISVLGELLRHMPTENYIYYGDSSNAPYGVKTNAELINLSVDVADYLADQGVKAIVVACNTATSAAIQVLRKRYDIPIIGMEPALKPAVENTTEGQVAVMATEVTLREKKFVQLMERLDAQVPIHKIPCPALVPLVENGCVSGMEIERAVRACFQGVDIAQITSVVLGCTHFVFLKDVVRSVLGENVKIYDGNYGTARHLNKQLESRGLLNTLSEAVDIQIVNSLSQDMVNRSKDLLDLYKHIV